MIADTKHWAVIESEDGEDTVVAMFATAAEASACVDRRVAEAFEIYFPAQTPGIELLGTVAKLQWLREQGDNVDGWYCRYEARP